MNSIPQLVANSRSVPPKGSLDTVPQPPETVIKPASAWQMLDLAELWQYRDLLFVLTWRDISVRYKQTVLGIAWSVLQPTLMMIVFAIVFGRLAGLSSGDLPYPLFVFTGLLPWFFFSTAVTNAATSVVANERLVTKVYFPRLMIPISAILAAFVDFLIASGILAALMFLYQVTPTWNLLLLPPLMLIVFAAAVGLGSFFAALNVAYRDARYLVSFLVQLWMFATPSIYMAYDMTDHVPAALKTLLNLNPLTPLIASFRAAALGQHVPWTALGASSLTVAVVLCLGLLYFRRVESSFADII